MATKINVVEKTPGQHLGYSVTTERITFTYGEDELTVKVSAKERDEENTIDICLDDDGGLINGVAEKSRRYAAQVVIPARRYVDQESDQKGENGETVMIPVAVPFDMTLCTLILWGMEE